MYRRIGIRIGLEVHNKLVSLIKAFTTFHTLFKLFTDGRQFSGKFRSKGIYVAIGTTTIAFGAIPVRTGKPTIYNHLKHTLALVLLFQVRTVVVVTFYT